MPLRLSPAAIRAAEEVQGEVEEEEERMGMADTRVALFGRVHTIMDD